MKPTFALPVGNPYSLISYLRKYKRQFWLQTAGGVIFNTVIVTGPILLGLAIDGAAALEMQVTPQNIRMFFVYCFAFVLLTGFFQYARYVKRWYLRDMSNRIACDIRAGFLSRTLNRPIESIEQESVGDMMSRTVGDVEQIVSTMQMTINETWDTWLLMITYFVVLLTYDYRITLLCSIPIPFAVFAAEAARHPLYRFSLNARKSAAVIASHLQKTLNGLTMLRLFGREEMERQRLEDYAADLRSWNIKTAVLQTGMMPVYATIASLGIVGVIGLGGMKVIEEQWTIGRFVAFLAMFSAMANRTWVAARVFNQFHAAKAAWDRVKEKLKAIEGSRSMPTQVCTESPRQLPEGFGKSIEVEKLSFAYPGSERETISGISFSARQGEWIGVTGPVGSGKSALAACLTSLYPYEGSFRIDGVEAKSLPGDIRSGVIAYSGQDAFLFSTSIRENITFAVDEQDDVDRKRLENALKISALWDDLSLFADGLETVVGEKGVKVSGGQRQRIALARAIYTNNPILILDDPFSAVDIRTEEKIMEGLITLTDRIIILMTHRVTPFKDADQILVIRRGRMEERGIHENLMADQGTYARIFGAQVWMEEEEAHEG